MTDHHLELHTNFNRLYRIADDYRGNMCGVIEFLPNVIAAGKLSALTVSITVNPRSA